MKTVRLLISGTVQGVWFRGWTKREAAQLGLSGWVRNRRDGRVEAVISGPEDKVNTLVAACHVGPPAAAVARVTVTPEGSTPETGFHQLPDE